MDSKEIESAVADIMIQDGPDGHCDGSEIIAKFIDALLNGNGDQWIKEYRKNNNI